MTPQRDAPHIPILSRLGDDQPQAVGTPCATLADQIVSWLASAGVDTYFGVPGGAIEPLFNALARQQRENHVRIVPTRSEAGAAFAADGFFRECGRIAVCTTTSGPGISNLITAVMSAHADRVPMLILTPQTPAPKLGRGALQDSSPDGYDLTRVLRECTRFSTILSGPEQAPRKLKKALSCAMGAPMGPVHLSVPTDLLAGPRADFSDHELASEAWTPRPVDSAGLSRMANVLAATKRPIFYIGDDAGPCSSQLCDLAEQYFVSVVSSPAGKRWVDHFHRAYAGVVGFSGHARARTAVAKADLIVAFGATFDELSTDCWTALPRVPIISIDYHAEHATRLPNTQPVVARLDDAIDLIANALARREKSPRSVTPPALSLCPPVEKGAPVHPAVLMRWLSVELPDDVVVHVDTGAGFSWSTRNMKRRRPNTYRVAMGLGSMGWAIGAVIGASVASGRRRICISGDGAMLMSSLELTVAVAEKLPVTYVVLNDSGLGMVRHGQHLAGSESIAHEIPTVRFDWLAQACGAKGYLIECADAFRSVPREAIADDTAGPYVLDVRIDRNAIPPILDRVHALKKKA